MNKMVREGIFAALFAIVVILIIGFLFYEFIPSQIIPDSSEYEQSPGTTKFLSQIEEEKQSEQENQKREVLKSYEITQEDLTYSDDVQYVKGKNHPFFDYAALNVYLTESGGNTILPSSSVTNSTSSETTTTTTNVTSGQNTSSTNTSSRAENTNNINSVNTSTLRDVSDSNRISK